MKILGDYHTHSAFSHGKGSVLQNAQAALAAGLQQIAITDHSFNHMLFAVKRTSFEMLKLARADAERSTGVKVLLGVEANLLTKDGQIDVPPEILPSIQVLVLGFHRFVKSNFLSRLTFAWPNILLAGRGTKKRVQQNTNALILAMEKYPIDVLAHLKHGFKIDVMRVAQKAVETNTLIELNASKMLFSKEELQQMAQIGVKFIVNSDAHTPEKVGQFDQFLKQLLDYGVPASQIVNLDKVPQFKTKGVA